MSMLRSTLKTLLIPQSTETISAIINRRSIKRWVAPTLRELRKRSKQMGPQEPEPRSGFIEWNYNSELFAFGKRLNENFQLPLLQTAFTHASYIQQEAKRQRDLGIEETDIQTNDNSELAEVGKHLTKEYVQAYLQYSLPIMPEEGQKAIANFLLSRSTLANISAHLGVKDLVFSKEFPPTEETMAHTLLAVVGALQQSSGMERAFAFIRDFVCTQLNQRDLLELWEIENPVELLTKVSKERQIAKPVPRLIGDCAKNTVLAAYQVGFYSNKKMMGTGFGENVDTAIQTAALNTLQTLFGIHDAMKPFNFKMRIEPNRTKIAA